MNKISKSKTSNNLIGNVKITTYKNGKKTGTIVNHNRCTRDMCEYLVNALTGKIDPTDRPNSIVPCGKDSNSALYPLNTWRIPSTGEGTIGYSDVSDINNPFVNLTLSFIIPDGVISEGIPIYGFKLYSHKDTNKEYASVWISTDHNEFITFSSGVNIEIDWTLQIQNAEVETEFIEEGE